MPARHPPRAMLQAAAPGKFRCRYISSLPQRVRGVPRLQLGSVQDFQEAGFKKEVPVLFPKGHFELEATRTWFCIDLHSQVTKLNADYLRRYGNTMVPMELRAGDHFTRTTQPLSMFLDATKHGHKDVESIYIAQASIADLPERLRLDLPTPNPVVQAGKGDVYDSSIWLGLAPTYTPLHKDPNPNLFVQLTGSKRVRLFSPEIGNAVFAHVQRTIGGRANATIRGEEMMAGKEKAALEDAVWVSGEDKPWLDHVAECEVFAGDGLFIPKGWWHSIKSVGQGMTGSVSDQALSSMLQLTPQANWWFR